MSIINIRKRDNVTTTFSLDKITYAIEKAMLSVKHGDRQDAEVISNKVYQVLLERKKVR